MAFKFKFDDKEKSDDSNLTKAERAVKTLESRIRGIKAQIADPKCPVNEDAGNREIARLEAVIEDVKKNT